MEGLVFLYSLEQKCITLPNILFPAVFWSVIEIKNIIFTGYSEDEGISPHIVEVLYYPTLTSEVRLGFHHQKEKPSVSLNPHA